MQSPRIRLAVFVLVGFFTTSSTAAANEEGAAERRGARAVPSAVHLQVARWPGRTAVGGDTAVGNEWSPRGVTSPLPPGTPTPPLPGPTPTVGASSTPADHAFARGDTNCSLAYTAADVVAAARTLDGESPCGNDDCDRDGDVDPDDVACTARCLFGQCPVPPHAPVVMAVAAESAPAVSPYAVVRVTATNLGGADAMQTARIGGQTARFIAFSPPDTLLLLVPDLEAGPAELVVSRGDIQSAPFELTIAAPEPIGMPDTLESLLDLADDILAQFLSSDLESIYGEDAAIIAEEVARAQEDLATERGALLANPTFTAARGEIDAAVDASGIPEQLRSLLQGLRGGSGLARRTSDGTDTAAQVGQAAATAGALAAEAGRANDVEESTLIGQALTSIGSAVAKVAGFRLFGIVPANPEPGEMFEVRGDRLNRLTDELLLYTEQREAPWRLAPTGSTADGLTFRLPDVVGVCGEARFVVEGLVARSNELRSGIRPVLLGLGPLVGEGAFKEVRATVSGVRRCIDARAELTRTPPGCAASFSLPALGIAGNLEQVAIRPPALTLPDDFEVAVSVDGVPSLRTEILALEPSALGLSIACEDGEQPIGSVVPLGSSAVCTAEGGSFTTPDNALPVEGTEFFPRCAREFQWTTSDPAVAAIDPGDDSTLPSVNVDFTAPGAAELRVSLFTDELTFVRREFEPRAIQVVDMEPPKVTLRSITIDPPGAAPPFACSTPPCIVEPGDTIEFVVEATDNFSVERYGFDISPGGALKDAETGCLAARCEEMFTAIVPTTFDLPGFTLAAVARDAQGLEGRSDEIQFFLAGDGDVLGAVRKASTLEVVDGAPVLLLDDGRRIVASDESNPAGFLIAQIPPDTYTLSVPAGRYRVGGAEEDFASAEVEVVILPNEVTTQDILLGPQSPGSSVRGRLVNAADAGNPLVDGTATALDMAFRPAGVAVTGSDGRYEITGLADGDYLLSATGPLLARSFFRFRAPTIRDLPSIIVYGRNGRCQSDLASFELTLGTNRGGGAIPISTGNFDQQSGSTTVHPEALIICVGGARGRPTFSWDTMFLTNVTRLTVSRPPVGVVWTLAQLDDEGAPSLTAPIMYGDHTQGRQVFPMNNATPDDLQAGELYRVQIFGESLGGSASFYADFRPLE